ncbi:hypothetical protein QBC47DRAFT_289309 [Echria macrotheca]|uniref:Rab-GAP TBC domain-containing protein n=1 Tax=Echria macrotheca TaxID=438768 RepID=A0AAJ0BQ52_9PEZI|nr:hypothetical protein QBC47DRAFT_289309 [Echria macrotheca]
MALQRLPSMRHKPRPARLASFRDDTGLIALRYEQTKQAEPPIPLPPPRNPLRTTARLSQTGSVVPVTIVPPPRAPPQEEHPLFRTQPLSPSSQGSHEWKRDSGLAPSSSSATLRDDYEEDFVYQKILDDIADAPSVSSVDELSSSSPAGDAPSSPIAHDQNLSPAPLRLFSSFSPSPTTTATESPVSALPSPTPTRASSLTKRLGKTFSIRSTGNKRLRKKTPSVDDLNLARDKDMDWVASTTQQDAAPVRGSPTTTDRERPPRLSAAAAAAAAENATNSSRQSQADSDFVPAITTSIPEDGLWDDFGNLSFSKRGSLMFGAKTDPFGMRLMGITKSSSDNNNVAPAPATDAEEEKPVMMTATTEDNKAHAALAPAPAPAPTTTTLLDESPSVPSIRVVSMDVERESQKVRSLYESGEGSGLDWQDGGGLRLEPTAEEEVLPSSSTSEEEEENKNVAVIDNNSELPSSEHTRSTAAQTTAPSPLATSTLRPASFSSLRPDSLSVSRNNRLEDWDDVDSADVDRYGFISRSQRRPGSATTTTTTTTQAATPSPRKRNVLTKRPGSAYSSSQGPGGGGGLRPPSRKVSARSLNTFASEMSTSSRRSTRSTIRTATNRLPHNRDRRWMDEAGGMLALQPAGINEEEEKTSRSGKEAEAVRRRKEAERTEKWRKMARVVNRGGQEEDVGHGMEFEFDVKNPKLIERTWKGIPDCWRGAAWHSFLLASARAWNDKETDEVLVGEFRRLQDVASPDDVQIDLDVPRTINGHILFRKRYRGGQRLLFRVLHAISLFFPGTRYVQGMASLAATLLCYYDEERCFVMLVRLWRYRGLERLYQPGFDGLMAALGDFEKRWLAGGDVAVKLNELAIDATAYGTRWYLTLFNLSIPFPAQLRVWDVFMLMGECPPLSTSSSSLSGEGAGGGGAGGGGGGEKEEQQQLGKGLDVLHATSAALIHALRDVLLDSDFENAMKALTAWIPVKDEDLLMKVARAEWRVHLRRGAGGEKKGKGEGKGKEKERGEDEKEKGPVAT